MLHLLEDLTPILALADSHYIFMHSHTVSTQQALHLISEAVGESIRANDGMMVSALSQEYLKSFQAQTGVSFACGIAPPVFTAGDVIITADGTPFTNIGVTPGKWFMIKISKITLLCSEPSYGSCSD